ncbi:4962_t:CDS:1 [Scutellospora calospora]|uniref:4962_t:CDS:1 n=1 Tax=Scutellospora calospora TaxID=85575 RepID=A0ACA9L7F2_9GLOM|nr:4962_t:CDS:1 [Scutellospora calospora]
MQNSRKINHLIKFCKDFELNFLTFDHYAHGLSTGSFLNDPDGNVTIGRWFKDLCLLMKQETCGPQILIGSSMGVWLALLVLLKNNHLKNNVYGIIGVAPSINFTEKIWKEVEDLGLLDNFSKKVPTEIIYNRPSKYSGSGGYPISLHFLQESRNHYLHKEILGGKNISCPITFIHGQGDEDVSYHDTLKWAKLLTPDENAKEKVKVVLIPDGDHRLSREQDLKVLDEEIVNML